MNTRGAGAQEWWRGRGRTACSRVPRPSGLSIVSVPPKAETRSASPSSPPPVVRQAPPQPSSPDVDRDRVDVLAHAHGRRRRARVLGGVRECLGDEVVGACLELGVEARDRDIDLDRQHAVEPRHELLDGRAEALVGEHGRVEAARELADLADGERELLLGPLEKLRRAVAAARHPSGCDAERLEGDDQPLLRAVVEVPLEPPPLRIAGRTSRSWAARSSRSVCLSSVASRTIVTTWLSSIGTTLASNWRRSPRIVGST